MKKERVVILSIAYHNMGVEFEYLKRYDEAIKTYLKAVSFSKDNLDHNDDVVLKLTSVLAQATQQVLLYIFICIYIYLYIFIYIYFIFLDTKLKELGIY